MNEQELKAKAIEIMRNRPNLSTREVADMVGLRKGSVAALKAHMTMGTYDPSVKNKDARNYQSKEQRITEGSKLFNQISSGEDKLLTRREAENILFHLNFPNPQAKLSEILKSIPHVEEGKDILVEGKIFFNKLQASRPNTSEGEYVIRLDKDAKEFFIAMAKANGMTVPALLSTILNKRGREQVQEAKEEADRIIKEQLKLRANIKIEDFS